METLPHAIALEDGGRLAAAADLYARLAAQGNPDAAFNLGYMNLRHGFLAEAADVFSQLIERGQRLCESLRGMAHVRVEQARITEAIELFDRAGSASESLWYRLHLPGDHAAAHRRNATRIVWSPAGGRPMTTSVRRLRVGYVGYGLIGTVARFLDPVLAAHDRDAVEVKLYRIPTPRELAADQLDVVIDLLGHMHRGETQLVIATQPAPLVCSYVGYPHATGKPDVWRVTDATCDPPGDGADDELLIRLPGCCWAYQPDPEAPSPAVRPHDGVVFASLNRPSKITAEVAKAWARIVAADVRHRLMVLAHGGEANTDVRELLVNAGVPGERLTLVPNLPRREYLERMAGVDVALDPWPYNGMTTTCDLLWQGVPVISLAGDCHRARVGASLLAAAGLPGWIATSIDDYVRLAIVTAHAAGGPAIRELQRECVRTSALLDGRRIAACLEATWTEQLRTISTASPPPAYSPA